MIPLSQLANAALVSAKSRGALVMIALYHPGESKPFAVVPASGWRLYEREGELAAECVIGVEVPEKTKT